MRVTTTVAVPAPGDSSGKWINCPDLPAVLSEDVVRSCEDLAIIVATQGRVGASLLRTPARYCGFRLLARYVDTHRLAGWVEWVRRPDSGVWVQWDEPATACMYGQHGDEFRDRVWDVYQLGHVGGEACLSVA